MTPMQTIDQQTINLRAKLQALDAEGVWVVGGSLRDALAGRHSATVDLDLAVVDAQAWSQRAAMQLGVRPVRLSARFPIWRVPLADGQIDVWSLPDGDIERDLRRRDFTMNAMAVPLEQFRRGDLSGLLDPFCGRADMQASRLRLVSATALRDDPLRMLRAIRLEAEGGWRPDAELRAALKRDAPQLARAAAERQWAELCRILLSARWLWALRRLEQSGLLNRLVPELAEGRGVEQRAMHRRDVFWHQIDAVRWLARLTGSSEPRGRRAAALWRELAPVLAQPSVRQSLEDWRLPLRLATLLHDIGKPQTRAVDTDGSTHFYGHAELGATMARSRLTTLRAPERTIGQVELLIEQHLRPGQLASPGRPPTDRALFRFHRAVGEAVTPLCWLFLADSLAAAGSAALLPRWRGYAGHVRRIIGWRPRGPERVGRILNGHEIMQVTGLSPGPLVGRIRAQIDEAAALGEVQGPTEARALARQLARMLDAESVSESVVGDDLQIDARSPTA